LQDQDPYLCFTGINFLSVYILENKLSSGVGGGGGV
jgi:hypothetical protein